MFVLGYTGCDPAAPAALYTAALTLTGATPAGVFASAADIAPNFAGFFVTNHKKVAIAKFCFRYCFWFMSNCWRRWTISR